MAARHSVRLPGLPWSPSFMAAYEAALGGPRTAIGAGRIKPGSVAAVVAAYLDSQQAFASKSAGTQRMRRGILNRFRDAIKLRAIKSDGHHAWDEPEIARYEAHYPIGTRERLAFALLLYAAQRRSDVVRMGRQHIRDGVLTVKQDKTGVTLAIPVHPHLRAVLDATPSENLTFLITENGKPYGGNYLSASFRQWCNAAGLPRRCVAHGLRKAACRRLAEAGCSANEIMSISGHATLKELIRYTAAADQARLARNALARTTSTPISPRTAQAGD
jgi:integrase